MGRGRGGACAYPRGSSERSEGGGARSAYPSRLEGRALLMIIVSKWTARGPGRAKRRRARNMRKATSIPGCRFVVHCVVMTLRSRGGAGRQAYAPVVAPASPSAPAERAAVPLRIPTRTSGATRSVRCLHREPPGCAAPPRKDWRQSPWYCSRFSAPARRGSKPRR